jgi:hypothetical protein
MCLPIAVERKSFLFVCLPKPPICYCYSHTIEDMAAPFRHLANLQVLTLSRNQIKSVGNQALIGLSSLQELDLVSIL